MNSICYICGRDIKKDDMVVMVVQSGENMVYRYQEQIRSHFDCLPTKHVPILGQAPSPDEDILIRNNILDFLEG